MVVPPRIQGESNLGHWSAPPVDSARQSAPPSGQSTPPPRTTPTLEATRSTLGLAYQLQQSIQHQGAAVLLEHLLNLFEAEAVGALGIFVADSKGLPCLRLVHGLRKYPGPLAQHSPNKNKAFGYLDDIEGEAGELVLVDSAMLSPTTASRVLTLDHHLAELEAHPGRLSIPVNENL
eukprot:jgi/Psemu1/28744/gm1.28744_g